MMRRDSRMIIDNRIAAKTRVKELLFDWLAIACLPCLFGAAMLFTHLS